jgi:5-methylcytosine-specific restriction endonuclease McrA
MKLCSRCETEKPLKDFGKNKTRPDGLAFWCKACTSVYFKQYLTENPTKNKDYWTKNQDQLKLKKKLNRLNNIHQCREEEKERYWENRDHLLERHKRYYATNPEPHKQKSREWAKQNPDRVRELSRIKELSRRARKKNQFVEYVDPKTLYEMHGGMCGICEQFVSEDNFHVDHVIPLSKGGLHGYVNVQPAHPRCNLSKGAKV